MWRRETRSTAPRLATRRIAAVDDTRRSATDHDDHTQGTRVRRVGGGHRRGHSSTDLSAGSQGSRSLTRGPAPIIVGIVVQEDGEVRRAAGGGDSRRAGPGSPATPSSTGCRAHRCRFRRHPRRGRRSCRYCGGENGLPLDGLRDILLYHVTSGRRNSTSVLAAPSYQMLNGNAAPDAAAALSALRRRTSPPRTDCP